MERLTQRVESLGDVWLLENGKTKEMITDSNEYRKYFEKLAEYEDAEEQGLLVRLPCKLGDVPYWISDEDDDGNKVLTIKKGKPITGISVRKDGVYVSTNDFELGALCKIGSRWALLTREDAERKLREMEELQC